MADGRPTVRAVKRLMVLAAVLVLVAACSGSGDDRDATAPSQPEATPADRLTNPNATCGDYLDATEAQRAAVTTSALVVARRDAGAARDEPDQERREFFAFAVGIACQEQRSALMRDVIAGVLSRDSSYLR